MTDTRKEQALEAIRTAIAGIVVGYPVSDPFNVVFTEVYRDDPDDKQVLGKNAVAAVLEGTETKREQSYPTVYGILAVIIEVHVMRVEGESTAKNVNRHLGAIEYLLRQDRTVGGIITDIRFEGTEVVSRGLYNNYGSGVLRTVMQYRHNQDDPRLP